MDIVPYISAIRTSSGLKDTNIRSASGKYSVMYNATGVAGFITVNGFNLNPNAVRVVNTTTAATSAVSVSSGVAVTYAAGKQ